MNDLTEHQLPVVFISFAAELQEEWAKERPEDLMGWEWDQTLLKVDSVIFRMHLRRLSAE